MFRGNKIFSENFVPPEQISPERNSSDSSLLDFRPFQTIFLQVRINFGPELQGGGGWAGGGEGRAGVGGWGGRRKNLPGEDGATSRPQMVLTTQLDRRDTIPVEGTISGWLHPIGALHRCQCVGQCFTRL